MTADLSALLAAATPGPWFNDHGKVGRTASGRGIGEMDHTDDGELAARAPVLAQACLDYDHLTRRMLQALDAYWLHCDGLPKGRHPRGRYDAEDWWIRFTRYRDALASLRAATGNSAGNNT